MTLSLAETVDKKACDLAHRTNLLEAIDLQAHDIPCRR